MVKVLTFDEAIEDSETFKAPKAPKNSKISETSYHPRERHLLLGNGFSIECFPKIFKYRSLFKWADFSKAPNLLAIFKKKKTKDFEQVIRILLNALEVLKIYNKASPDAVNIRRDANAIKGILIDTIVNRHPPGPQVIASKRLVKCRSFLKYFLRGENKIGGNIYTLNYDLLLYWALMHSGVYLGHDGFRLKTGSNSLIWSIKHPQTVHYLHGALHLSYDGTELHKFSWKGQQASLLSQVQKKQSLKKLPLFVAEGTSQQKLDKIGKNAYLSHCYNSFLQKMEQPNDALFIFGHSLNKNDNHIFDCIIEGKIPRVYVGLHGYATSKKNRAIIALANGWKYHRRNGYSLEVKFFYAKGAEVWGNRKISIPNKRYCLSGI